MKNPMDPGKNLVFISRDALFFRLVSLLQLYFLCSV